MSRTVRSHQRSEKLRIYRAIPEGSRRSRSQPAALRALEQRINEEADLGRLRSDAEHNALTVARAVVFSAHWKTMVTRPGWDTLMERTGLKRTSIAKYLRLFREWGYLGVVATGSTHRTRGHKRGDTDGNLAGEYVLCVPGQEPVEETRTPSLGSRREPVKPHASARETTPETADRPWPMHQTPGTRGQRLAATQRLQQQAPVLNRIPAVRLRSVLKPWFLAGWTPAQVLYALDHTPDGQARWHTADVRHVPGWIRSRLAAWDGHTPPQALGAGRTTDLTAGNVAQLPRANAEPVADGKTHASLARRLLAATKRLSDKSKPMGRGLGVSLPDRDGRLATAAEAPTGLGGDDEAAGGWLLTNAAKQHRRDVLPGRVNVAGLPLPRRLGAIA